MKIELFRKLQKVIAFEIFNQISNFTYQNMRNLILHHNVFYKQ